VIAPGDGRSRAAGVALVVVSGTAFGALAIFAKLAYAAGADPIAVLAARFGIAGATMTLLMLVQRRAWPRGHTLLALALLGGVGYVGQSLAFFTALTLASAGLVSLLLYVYPAIVTAAAVVLFRERLTRRKVVALALALAGSVLTVGGALAGRPLGIVLGVLSAFAYAAYILAGARVLPRVGAIPASTVIILAAATSYGLLALVQRPAFPASAAGWGAVVGLALVSTVVAVVTFFAGLERVGAADASTLSTTEPLLTIVLAAVVLGERVSLLQVVGGLLILAAVVILARAGRVAPRAAAAASGGVPAAGAPAALARRRSWGRDAH
jgi:drug/metabolite transporter (DMT)-like permease